MKGAVRNAAHCAELVLKHPGLLFFLLAAVLCSGDQSAAMDFAAVTRFTLVDDEVNAQLVLDVPTQLVEKFAREGPKGGLLTIKTSRRDLHQRIHLDKSVRDSTVAFRSKESNSAGDALIIQVWGRVPVATYPDNVTRSVAKRRTLTPDRVADLQRYVRCKDTVTQGKTCEQTNLEDEFIPSRYVEGKPWAHFTCERIDLSPHGGCSAYGVFRQRKFAYIMRRSVLSEWKEIDEEVRALLNSFVVSDSLIAPAR